jgi:D-alanyl-D-alanine carboxypeptidase (penicillin-binding protein 5/6)
VIVILGMVSVAPVAQAGDPQEAPRATLKEGDSGAAVEGLQRRLNARLEPTPGLDVDGDFGPATKAALVRFQRSKGLQATGVVDAKTWDALGPLPPAEPDPPAPEVVNGQKVEKRPPDPLDGPPFVTAKAWVVVDGRTGTRLGGHEDDASRDMASTTKIMTALVVLRVAARDPKVLNEVVTFSERADKTPGSTSSIRAGESLSVRELLFGLLLPSGNDASVALGEHFGGRLGTDTEIDPLTRFVAEMNRVAKELGLEHTHFVNTHGLPAAGHQASARDLARLAREAQRDPTFAACVGTPRHGAAVTDKDGKGRNLVWSNTNRLLWTEGYDGVKTGSTAAAGLCVVASGQRGPDRLLVVVLGSASAEARDADVRNLFRWGWHLRQNGAGAH